MCKQCRIFWIAAREIMTQTCVQTNQKKGCEWFKGIFQWVSVFLLTPIIGTALFVLDIDYMASERSALEQTSLFALYLITFLLIPVLIVLQWCVLFWQQTSESTVAIPERCVWLFILFCILPLLVIAVFLRIDYWVLRVIGQNRSKLRGRAIYLAKSEDGLQFIKSLISLYVNFVVIVYLGKWTLVPTLIIILKIIMAVKSFGSLFSDLLEQRHQVRMYPMKKREADKRRKYIEQQRELTQEQIKDWAQEHHRRSEQDLRRQKQEGGTMQSSGLKEHQNRRRLQDSRRGLFEDKMQRLARKRQQIEQQFIEQDMMIADELISQYHQLQLRWPNGLPAALKNHLGKYYCEK